MYLYFSLSLRGIVSFLCILSLSFVKAYSADPEKASSILEQTIKANKLVKSVSITMLIEERIENEIIKKKSDFKVNFNPYQVYIKQHYPNEGMEVLYSDKFDDGKAYINRNTRALSVLKLAPLGNTVRKGNHHSMFKAGFSFFVDVLEQLHTKYDSKNASVWHYEGLVKYADIICYKIIFKSPDFKYIDYKLLPGEDLEKLSTKFKICDYMIFENNPDYKSFDSFTPGLSIKIPNDYAKEIVVYINKDTYLPTGMKVYDDKGFYEEYAFTRTELNPNFSLMDFDMSNPAYGFSR